MNSEFLHTKDPLFFNKPPTEDLKFQFKEESVLLTYRIFGGDQAQPQQNAKRLAPYEDNETDMISCLELDDGLEIIPTKNGKFLASLHAPEHCYSHIIGAKGHKRREIENSTGTHIKIPKPGVVDEEIIITGPTERGVAAACNRINMILLQLREKEHATHFVSIPMISNEIKLKFEEFKNLVLYGTPLRGVEESIFQKPEKLHLTITALVLWDDSEIQECIKILNDKKYELWPVLFPADESFKIIMEGLEIMNDDPKDVNVLYGKVRIDPLKYNASFQRFVNGISDGFVRRAFAKQQFDNVKLHVTLMNSIFRNSDDSDDNVKRKSFDASLILEKYGNFHFGEADLKTLHLSIRFQTGDDKYYKPECIVEL